LVGLIGLSLVPHQEARFLSPLLVPIVFMFCWNEAPTPVSFWFIWIVFNVLTTYVFGIIHQGGLIPTLGFLQRQTTGIQDCHVLDTGDLTCSFGPSSKFNSINTIIGYSLFP
jgi:phosphatidylinositol glycan class Z